MPIVTFADVLETTIPPSNSSAGGGGEHKHSEDGTRNRSTQQQPSSLARRRHPSVWRLVLISILLTGAIVVAIVLWRRNDTTNIRNNSNDFYDDGRFRNPSQAQWALRGDDIAAPDALVQIQLSGDARTLAVVNTTYIQLYQWRDNEEQWIKLAGFEAPGVKAVTLAGDGRRLAVATEGDNRVRFYDNLKAGRWSLRPEFLGAPQDCWISLDYSGILLAVGKPVPVDGSVTELSARVQILRWNFGRATWTPETENLSGAGASTRVHWAADGKTIVDVSTAGQVLTWQRRTDDATASWIRKGNALSSEQEGTFFGQALSLSGNGNVLAVASPEFEGRGRVQVYDFKQGRWQARRQGLSGSSVDYSFGSDVCLSANGNLLSAVHGDVVRLYQAVGNDRWSVVGTDISGNENEPPVWDQLECSASGRVLAVSSRAAQIIRIVQVVEAS